MFMAFFMNLSSLTIACLASSLVFMWLCMEISVLSFILILLSAGLSQDYVATIKYFLFQAMASILFLISLTLFKYSKSFSLLILMMKLGMAPFHLWFMAMMDKISVLNLIWVSIVQKIIPLRFVMLLKADENLMLGLGLSFLMSSVHMLLQSKLKKMIGASSIYSACWVMISSIVCEALSWGFFMAYSIFQVFLLSLSMMKLITPLKSSFAQSSWMHMCLILLMLSMSGFPPSPLFFMKLSVLMQFMVNGHLGWSLALSLGASIVMFNYLNMISILFTFNPRNYVV